MKNLFCKEGERMKSEILYLLQIGLCLALTLITIWSIGWIGYFIEIKKEQKEFEESMKRRFSYEKYD